VSRGPSRCLASPSSLPPRRRCRQQCRPYYHSCAALAPFANRFLLSVFLFRGTCTIVAILTAQSLQYCIATLQYIAAIYCKILRAIPLSDFFKYFKSSIEFFRSLAV
jgi:hypothetical protein